MKIISLVLLSSLSWGSVSHAVSHGASYDLNNGIGYTLLLEKFWAGLSLNAANKRFGDNQIVVSPRVYANYTFCTHENIGLFHGVSYSDTFGLRYDSIIDKHRVLALTGGVAAKVLPQFQVSTWVNIIGMHEDEVYDSTLGHRSYDTSSNRRTFFEFGGLLLTYIF
jgi:hypothetical protein